jgi:hypothetical protein
MIASQADKDGPMGLLNSLYFSRKAPGAQDALLLILDFQHDVEIESPAAAMKRKKFFRSMLSAWLPLRSPSFWQQLFLIGNMSSFIDLAHYVS